MSSITAIHFTQDQMRTLTGVSVETVRHWRKTIPYLATKTGKAARFSFAELLGLARRAFHAGECEANTGQSADRQRNAFEVKAKALGFSAFWPGLWPELKRKGREIHLPKVPR